MAMFEDTIMVWAVKCYIERDCLARGNTGTKDSKEPFLA